MATTRAGRRTGRSLLAAGVALAGLVATAVPAQAASDQWAAVFKVRFAGYVSMAGWTTCPDIEAVDLGTLCESADVLVAFSSGSEQWRNDEGKPEQLHDQKSGVVKTWEGSCIVDEVVDEEGGLPYRVCLHQGERFGRATDAAVRVDPRLVATWASASVPVQIEDEEWNTTHGTVAVTASFTGTGDTRRIDERGHMVDRFVMFREGTRGWERDCTATATFGGVPAPGALSYCTMSRVRQGEVRVFHNVPTVES